MTDCYFGKTTLEIVGDGLGEWEAEAWQKLG